MAASILLYLLKANVVLLLFTVAYYGLLRRLTFFQLNRAYLLGALLFAAVYPALPVPALLPAEFVVVLPDTQQLTAASEAAGAAGPANGPAAGFDWQWLVVVGYALGAGLLALRLLAQLVSLAFVRRRSRVAQVLGQPVRLLAGTGQAFSFGHTIYLSTDVLDKTTELPAILRHEQAHVRQHHTLDVLFMQVAVALAWLNPAAWLLRRAVLDNLEYLADHAALQTGLDRRAYQYSLLRQQPGGAPVPTLAFYLDFPTLKNRITMLNQPASTTRQLGRYVLAAPLVALLALGYSAAFAQAKPTIAAKPGHFATDARYYVNGHPSTAAAAEAINPETITDMNVLTGWPAHAFTQNKERSVVFLSTKNDPHDAAEQQLKKQAAQATATLTQAQLTDLPAPAQAYIKSKYPDYRLAMVNKVAPVGNSGLRYQATIARGKRPTFLMFDGKGGFLQEL